MLVGGFRCRFVACGLALLLSWMCLIILVIFALGWLVGFYAICFVSCLAINSVVHFVYIYVVWCFALDLFNLRFDACVFCFVLLFDCGFY